MVRSLSNDLRERIVAAVAGDRQRCAEANGRDRRSHVIERHRDRLLALADATPDLTLEEVQGALREDGVDVGYGAVWRFFKRPHRTALRQAQGPAAKSH